MLDDPNLPPSPEEPEPSNPYAPPEAELRQAPRLSYHGTLPGQTFSASIVIGRSWEIYKQRFSLVFGLVVIPNGIVALYQIVGTSMAETVDQDSVMGIIGQYAFSLAGVILQLWLTCGQTKGLIEVARGEDANLGEAFQGGPYVLRTIGGTLVYLALQLIVVALLLAPAGMLFLAGLPFAAIVALIVGVFVAICISLVIRVRFEQMTYLIIDREFGVRDALRGSLMLTRGHTFDLVGLVLVGGVIGVSGILFCGVGILVTLPWMYLLLACIYVGLSDEHPELGTDKLEAADIEL
ncbi:MAG: hypothetical protein U0794_09000 [Isosphaeraceae bacterium]